jgi:hypothetical protein
MQKFDPTTVSQTLRNTLTIASAIASSNRANEQADERVRFLRFRIVSHVSSEFAKKGSSPFKQSDKSNSLSVQILAQEKLINELARQYNLKQFIRTC